MATNHQRFYDDEASAPFDKEDLIDEEDEEDGLFEFWDAEDTETSEPQRWMAPSLFGNILGRPAAQQPEVRMDDEIQRRGGLTPDFRDASSQGFGRERRVSAQKKVERIETPAYTGKLESAGSFEKRSPGWVEGWRPRRYLVRDRKLLYFQKKSLDRPLAVLDFDLLQYEIHCCWADQQAAAEERQRECDVCGPALPEDFGTFFLKPTEYPNKVFAFRGPLDDMKLLAEIIAQILRTRRAPKLEIEKDLSASNFWRYPFIHDADFRERAESGDIILFRGKGGRCQLLRSLTAGKYDHVAMVLRLEDDSVAILEATGNNGVATIPWMRFVRWGWHQCYQRMAYRKVYFNRDNDQMDALSRYINQIYGANYSLTWDKIFNTKTSFSFDEKGNDNTPPYLRGDTQVRDRTFFCSEVVAACLKRCGVLASARASCTYWPSSFSQYDHETLPLQPDVYIGQEEVLVFGP
jgi:hypothetical protein